MKGLLVCYFIRAEHTKRYNRLTKGVELVGVVEEGESLLADFVEYAVERLGFDIVESETGYTCDGEALVLNDSECSLISGDVDFFLRRICFSNDSLSKVVLFYVLENCKSDAGEYLQMFVNSKPFVLGLDDIVSHLKYNSLVSRCGRYFVSLKGDEIKAVDYLSSDSVTCYVDGDVENEFSYLAGKEFYLLDL